MKILVFLNKEYIADKIIKKDNNIIGKDEKGNELFVFKGINDFSKFKLKDGANFDTEENIIDKLILDNLNMQMQIDRLIESNLGGN